MASPVPHRPAVRPVAPAPAPAPVRLTLVRPPAPAPSRAPAAAPAEAPPAGPGRLLLAVADAGLAFAVLLSLWELGTYGYRLLCD
ncbi:hypothetical protein [Kitasatospora sp. NPDC094015]|uniref:hypothetical protein n=1 Tax=Kitasatospora sp. NPDC094015 TaxID=3155205 RepID=UPI0033194457